MSQALNNAMYAQGRADALSLALRAPDMDGTGLIAEEEKVPAWSKNSDYSGESIGIPVADEGQVWTLITPHNPAHYEGRPSTLRSLWALAHTKDPAKAKPWVASYGTSGLYMLDECCTYLNPTDGLMHTLRNLWNNNEYPPYTLNVEDRWEDLGPVPGQEPPQPEPEEPSENEALEDETLEDETAEGETAVEGDAIVDDEGKSSSGLLTED